MQRTSKQNRALHPYCTHVAEALNGAGFTQRSFYKEPLDLDFTMENVKDMYRFIGKKKWGVAKTSEMTTVQLIEATEEVIRACAVRGVELPPWPCNEKELRR